MAVFTIVSKHLSEKLISCIEGFVASKLSIDERKQGEWHIFQIEEHESTTEPPYVFLYRMAEVLENHIIYEIRDVLIQRIIEKHYFYFSVSERDKVLYYSRQRENNVNKKIKQRIKENMREYLKQAKHFNVEGFIKFRLQYYLDELKRHVDCAVDDYLIEKEYQDFIKLLKYFVEIQEPRVLEAHVLLDDGGNFQIRDASEKIVEQNQDEMNIPYLKEEVDNEEMLVSALVTVAPGKIVVHRHVQLQFPKVITTLMNIFEGKISVCDTCKRCSSTQSRVNYSTDQK